MLFSMSTILKIHKSIYQTNSTQLNDKMKISPSYIKNSRDLFKILKNINMTDKLITSLDIKSLYTNVLVSLKTSSTIKSTNLSPVIDKIIKICQQLFQ